MECNGIQVNFPDFGATRPHPGCIDLQIIFGTAHQERPAETSFSRQGAEHAGTCLKIAQACLR